MVAKYLNVESQVTFQSEDVINFRLSSNTRNNIWTFWEENCEESTLTAQLAKLKVTSKPRCQHGLDFPSTVEIVTIRNRQYYQSIWKVTSCQLLLLYKKYCEEFPHHLVSKGTFFDLKPFYIRNASKKDMGMCLCKLHLHFQWAVEALLQWAKKVEIEIPDTTTCHHLLSKLMVDCLAEQHMHVSWACMPNRKHNFDHITKNWNNMKELFFAADDGTICVPNDTGDNF